MLRHAGHVVGELGAAGDDIDLLVEQLCADTLVNSVKDLRIVAWLAEAWLRQRGLEGLVDGARLLQASLEQYWDGLYPLPEDGDLDARLAALEWFDRHMAQALGGVQIAAGASPAGRLFTLAEWALVLRHERQGAQAAGARRGATPAPGDGKELTRQHFNTAVAMTPAHFYQVLQQQLLATVAALEALAQALAARLDEQAPRLAAIEARLAECYQALQELAGLSWEAAAEADEDDAAWADEDAVHGTERRTARVADRRRTSGRAGAPRSGVAGQCRGARGLGRGGRPARMRHHLRERRRGCARARMDSGPA